MVVRTLLSAIIQVDLMTHADNPGDPKRVLIVDDNETARWILAEILETEGYAIVEAGSADQALLRLAEDADISAIVSDIEMPGSMNGVEMAALILQESPNMVMLLTSGRYHPSVDELPGNAKFLLKPWAPREIIRELATLLSLK